MTKFYVFLAATCVVNCGKVTLMVFFFHQKYMKKTKNILTKDHKSYSFAATCVVYKCIMNFSLDEGG